MSYFYCSKCSGTFDPAFTYCHVCEDVSLIEQLQAKIAELEAENAKLHEQVDLQVPKMAFTQLKEQLAKAEQRVAEAFIEYMVDLKQQDFAFTGSTTIGIEKCETAIRSGEYRKFMKGE